jgi:hypothetical protein
MSRKRNRKTKVRSFGDRARKGVSREQGFIDLRRLLSNGLGKRAVGLARDLVKHEDLNEEEKAALAHAFGLRASEMLAAKQDQAAHSLVTETLRHHPHLQPHMPVSLVLDMEARGSNWGVLDSYLSDPAQRERIDEAIRCSLRSPQQLATCKRTEHPLVCQAKSIWQAWTALEDNERHAARDQLQAIAPDSPFADWRYFLQALADWYEGNSDGFAANIEQVSCSSVLTGAICELRRLRDGHKPETAAGQRIYQLFGANNYRVRAECAMKSSNPTRREREIQALYHDILAANRPALALRLAGVFLKNCLDSGARLPYRFRRFDPTGFYRIQLRAWRELEIDRSQDWLQVAKTLTDPLQLAVVYRHIGSNWWCDAREDEDEKGGHLFFKESIKHLPLASTYHQWLQNSEYDSDDVLLAWQAQFPEDGKAAIIQLNRARYAGDIAKARASLTRLRETDFDPAEAELITVFLDLDELLGGVRTMTWPELEAASQAIAASGSIHRLIGETVAFGFGPGPADEKQRLLEQLVAYKRPLAILEMLHAAAIQLKQDVPELPGAIGEQLAECSLLLADFKDLLAIRDYSWCPPLDTQTERLVGILQRIDGTERLELLDLLEAIPRATTEFMFTLSQPASAELTPDAPLLLAYRAVLAEDLLCAVQDCCRELHAAAAYKLLEIDGTHRSTVLDVLEGIPIGEISSELALAVWEANVGLQDTRQFIAAFVHPKEQDEYADEPVAQFHHPEFEWKTKY